MTASQEIFENPEVVKAYNDLHNNMLDKIEALEKYVSFLKKENEVLKAQVALETTVRTFYETEQGLTLLLLRHNFQKISNEFAELQNARSSTVMD